MSAEREFHFGEISKAGQIRLKRYLQTQQEVNVGKGYSIVKYHKPHTDATHQRLVSSALKRLTLTHACLAVSHQGTTALAPVSAFSKIHPESSVMYLPAQLPP